MPRVETRHYLCNFEGLVEPQVIAGPFKGEIPDEVVIKALKEMDEEDLLFGLTLAKNGDLMEPRTWAFTNVTMDDLREKAGVTWATGKDLMDGGKAPRNG